MCGAARQPARESEVFERASANLQPRGQTLPSCLGDLELDRPPGLLLDYGCTASNLPASSDVTDADLHEITSAQLRVDCEIEQGAVPDKPPVLQVEAYLPDLLGLEGLLGSDLEAGVPDWRV